MALLGWFKTRLRLVSGLSDALYGPLTMERFETDETFRQRVLAFVREADLAISSIDSEAIRNAQRLLAFYGSEHNPERDNPSTTVHLLVQELNRYLR